MESRISSIKQLVIQACTEEPTGREMRQQAVGAVPIARRDSKGKSGWAGAHARLGILRDGATNGGSAHCCSINRHFLPRATDRAVHRDRRIRTGQERPEAVHKIPKKTGATFDVLRVDAKRQISKQAGTAHRRQRPVFESNSRSNGRVSMMANGGLWPGSRRSSLTFSASVRRKIR